MKTRNIPVHAQLSSFVARNLTMQCKTVVTFKRCKANNYHQTTQELQVQH